MKNSYQSITYSGGCHCQSIRFKVKIDKFVALDCNCSICYKKGFLHLIIPLENFTLLSGSEFLTTYTFNTHIAKHKFCRKCGIHPFYRPRDHPELIDVNLPCLDEKILSKFEIKQFDGVNWEENIKNIRNLS